MHPRRPLSVNFHLWKMQIYDTEKRIVGYNSCLTLAAATAAVAVVG